MNRLLAIGVAVSLWSVVQAAEPVSVYPPSPGGTLSQPLTSVVSGGIVSQPTVSPVLVSQPSWGGTVLPQAVGSPRVPLLANAMAPRYLAPRQTFAPCSPGWSGGCSRGGSLLDRIRAWLCGGSSPSITRSFVPATPMAPLQEWFPGHCPTPTGADCASGVPSACDGSSSRGFPMGRFGGRFAKDACAAPVPVAIGPRPVVIPLPSTWDRTPNCGVARPGLLRRILAFFTRPLLGGEQCAPVGTVYGVPYSGTPAVGAYPSSVIASPSLTGGYQFAAPRTAAPTPLVMPLVRTPALTPPSTPAAAPTTSQTLPLPSPVTATQPFTQQK